MQPEFLYKIISKEAWEESLQKGKLILSPMDDSFIHLATKEQVPRVCQKFWKGQDPLVLKIDTSKITGRLVLEANPGGSTKFYHLYGGTIPLDAVLEVSGVPRQNKSG